MKKNILLTIVICVAGFLQTQAQSSHRSTSIFGVSWELAFPTDNKYLSKTSLAGFRMEYRKKIKPELSLGIGMSWNSFDEYFGKATYESTDGSSAVTSDMVRHMYTFPMTALIHYYPGALDRKAVKFNVGLGIGAQYAEQNTYVNVYVLSNNNWGFVMRPEAGLTVKINNGISALLTASYQMATNKNEVLKMDKISQFGLNIGAAWDF
jgi:outer membrane protein W